MRRLGSLGSSCFVTNGGIGGTDWDSHGWRHDGPTEEGPVDPAQTVFRRFDGARRARSRHDADADHVCPVRLRQVVDAGSVGLRHDADEVGLQFGRGRPA
jgi:hypothetical protein